MKDGRVIMDKKPEAWEALDLAVLKRAAPKEEGGWCSPSSERSAGSWSGCSVCRDEVDATVGAVGGDSVLGVVT